MESSILYLTMILIRSNQRAKRTLKKLLIPRLELNAAVLLARWLHRIKIILESQLNIIGIDAWTDSSIVLLWLVNHHVVFKIYVSNQVHKIQTFLLECVWSHEPSADNPTDYASRRVIPNEMVSLSTYWHGPDFIHSDPAKWYVGAPEVTVQELSEVWLVSLLVTIQVPATKWFEGFLSYGRLVHVVAWITRFINSCRHQVSCVRRSFLKTSELIESVWILVLESQRQHLPQLLDEMSHNCLISSKPLARLHLFIGSDGVVRVGCRLRYSQLTYDCKHPMLLAKKSHLATLLCRHWHKISCYTCPRVITAMVSQQFWIMSIRSVTHRVGNQCSASIRFDHQPPQLVMADLPAMRVQQCQPFARVDIDFAGPLQLQETRLRKARTYKVYIAVFICFAVKATHLEVVTELFTSAFLAALDRFVARRDLPSDIFTDCGTNFFGAVRQLRNLSQSHEGQAALGERYSLLFVAL